MNEPIQCTGNELPEVLAGLRAQGKPPWALDVIIPASYSVEYFQTFPNKPQDASSGANQSRPDPARSVKGVRQVAGHLTQKPVAAGGDEGAEKPKSVSDAPALDLPVATPAPLCSFCGGSLTADGTCEICARLWAIREKAAKNRKLYKPKRNDHARLPHAND